MGLSIDREKTIKGLESLRIRLLDIAMQDSIFMLDVSMVENAIAMLKEQEHNETFIVIDNKTGEEADTYNIALHEDWAKHLCYCDMEGWAIEDDGTLLLVDECGRFAYADRERFKVVWDA